VVIELCQKRRETSLLDKKGKKKGKEDVNTEFNDSQKASVASTGCKNGENMPRAVSTMEEKREKI